MTSLTGRVILVTGASAGIGLAIAEKLADQGAQVIACARNIQRIEDLNSRLGNGKRIYAIRTDLTEESEVLALFKEIHKKFGKLDVLINNAGMNAAGSSLTNGDFTTWTNILNLNVLGLTLATREAVKLILLSGSTSGHIINVNSVIGHAVPTWTDGQFYSGTKHMVTTLTEGLRKSVQAQGIKVTSLSPGLTETEILARSHGKDAATKQYRQFKALQPMDVADAVVYVLTTPSHVNIDELTIKSLFQVDFCNPDNM